MCRARRPPCKDGSASPGTAGFLPMLGGPAGDRVVDYNAAAFSHLRREIRRSSRAIPACKAGQDLQDVMSNPLLHTQQLTAALHSTVRILGFGLILGNSWLRFWLEFWTARRWRAVARAQGEKAAQGGWAQEKAAGGAAVPQSAEGGGHARTSRGGCALSRPGGPDDF